MKFLKFDVFTSFSSNIYRKSCLLPQRLWPLTSQTAPPLSGSGKPPYGAKHLAVAPTLLTTSRVELISWSELRRRRWMHPAARAASTSEVISGHATGMSANTQKKNKKGTKKRRKTSEGRHVVTRGSHWSARWFPVSSYWLQKVPMSTQGSTGAEAEEGAEEGQAGHALFQCRGL